MTTNWGGTRKIDMATKETIRTPHMMLTLSELDRGGKPISEELRKVLDEASTEYVWNPEAHTESWMCPLADKGCDVMCQALIFWPRWPGWFDIDLDVLR